MHATRAARRAAREQGSRRRWIAEHQQIITSTLERLLREGARLGLRPDPSEDPGDDSTDQEYQPVSGNPDGDVDGAGDGDLDGAGPGLGDYLAWLAEDLADDAVADGTFGALGLALGELRGHPVVTAAPTNHGIHQAIRAADRLRADYAALTGLALSRSGGADPDQ